MSHCLNPYCRSPQNPDSGKFCAACGFKLLLGDRYRAMNAIGRGGFGRTFLAVDEYKPSHPKCVIKQFFPQNQNSSDPERERELFRREAVRLEQLGEHPQIPELLAHFEQADYQYLVQEFIEGRNLLQQLTRIGTFTEVQIWHLLNDLLPVLEFIHDNQVIHRDIKPQNIILRPNGQYVLVDFGAAKSIAGADLPRTGTSIGSPEFIAPEQAIGKATFASDLYSLGVTCIYLMTQVRPADLFDTEEGAWVWQKHLHSPVNSILSTILDKLLQGPTKWRYQSAAAVLQDLHAASVLAALGLTEDDKTQKAAIASSLGQTQRQTSRVVIDDPHRATAIDPTPAPPIVQSQTTTMPATVASTWSCTRTLTGHTSWVRAVVINPDGQTLASGSGDKTIKIWRMDTGELLHTIPAHTAWVRAIAVSPNGQMLASGSNDKLIKLWRWHQGELLRTLSGHTDWVRSVAFSPDGQTLLSGSQDITVRLWRVATGEVLQTLTGHEHWVTTVAFSPTTSAIASGSRDKTIRLWNRETGSPLATLEGHTDSLNTIAISPDGRTLASGSDDKTIKLWDLDQLALQRTLIGHDGAVHGLTISPDGETLISASQDGTIKLWNLHTGALLASLPDHRGWVWSVAISADGQAIASGSWDAVIKLWHKKD